MVSELKRQKIWLVDYFKVRRHSRVLYLPLDPVIVGIHDIRKGDTIKAMLVEVIKAPREESEEAAEAGKDLEDANEKTKE